MATAVSSHPVSYDNDYQAYSLSDMELAYRVPDQSYSSGANIYLTRGANAVTYIYFNFDFNIPTDATIDSVSCKAALQISNSSSSNISSRYARLYAGSTAKGSSKNLTTTRTIATITAGTWTATELNNAKLRLYAKRASSNVDSNYSMILLGAVMNVTYTEYTGNKVHIKVSGTWKQASKEYIKVSGKWKQVSKVYKKVSGSWVEQSDKSAMFDPNAIYKKG